MKNCILGHALAATQGAKSRDSVFEWKPVPAVGRARFEKGEGLGQERSSTGGGRVYKIEIKEAIQKQG